jgi:hypothetical protein
MSFKDEISKEQKLIKQDGVINHSVFDNNDEKSAYLLPNTQFEAA